MPFAAPDLLVNALWIFALAGALAAWSYTDWHRSQTGRSRREALNNPRFIVPFDLSMALFSTALLLQGRSWWEILAWAALAILFSTQAALYWRRARRSGWE